MIATTRRHPANTAARRIPTITFQPTDAASAVIAAVVKDRAARKPSGGTRIKSALINEALLVHFADFLTDPKAAAKRNGN